MSIKHPKGKRIDAFDWFIGDGLVLARCRDPGSLIWRVQWRILLGELIRKKLSKKMDTGEEFKIFSSLVMHP